MATRCGAVQSSEEQCSLAELGWAGLSLSHSLSSYPVVAGPRRTGHHISPNRPGPSISLTLSLSLSLSLCFSLSLSPRLVDSLTLLLSYFTALFQCSSATEALDP
uniref:Uncharacterized protein n=1 Tax=Physcomitrium patens TaxID=3218 RepID=A0A2K1IS63_PHYPA|nr:hypothetical protein PHYPA_026240 [Physcomitrium patens]